MVAHGGDKRPQWNIHYTGGARSASMLNAIMRMREILPIKK
jgi:hypothetical protein